MSTLEVRSSVQAALADTRTPLRHEADYRLVTDLPTQFRRASLRDLSAGGAALLLDHAIDPGKMLLIVLAEDVPAKLARVRYAIATGRGQWSVGCSFAHRLSDEELHAVLDAG